MSKRKADDMEEGSSKFPENGNYDLNTEDYDSDSDDDNEKYEIMKEDDIEGQEAGEIGNEGGVQITPFNMREEMEEGHFDTEGNYHWNKETNIRDNWLENIDWVKIKDKDGKTVQKQQSEDEDESQFDLIAIYKKMLDYMKEGETVAMALRRLGGTKSLSASERLKMKKAGIAIDRNNTGDQEAVIKLTELADSILTNMGNMDIYQETYQEIFENVNRTKDLTNETPAARGVPDLDMYADDFDAKEKAGLDTIPKTSASQTKESTPENNSESNIQWEFKRELNDEKIEGPYSTKQMNKWIHEDYFKTQVWVRRVGTTTFYSSKRTDFELYL